MVGLALVYRSAISGRDYTTVTGRDFSTARTRLGPLRWVALGACLLWMLVALAAPMTFLVLGSFMRRYGFFHIADPFTTRNWEKILEDSVFISSLQNSMVIAVCVGPGTMLLYTLIAYFLVRSHARTVPLVDALTWLPWAVPGILMSLGLLWLFLATPIRSLL